VVLRGKTAVQQYGIKTLNSNRNIFYYFIIIIIIIIIVINNNSAESATQ